MGHLRCSGSGSGAILSCSETVRDDNKDTDNHKDGGELSGGAAGELRVLSTAHLVGPQAVATAHLTKSFSS